MRINANGIITRIRIIQTNKLGKASISTFYLILQKVSTSSVTDK